MDNSSGYAVIQQSKGKDREKQFINNRIEALKLELHWNNLMRTSAFALSLLLVLCSSFYFSSDTLEKFVPPFINLVISTATTAVIILALYIGGDLRRCLYRLYRPLYLGEAKKHPQPTYKPTPKNRLTRILVNICTVSCSNCKFLDLTSKCNHCPRCEENECKTKSCANKNVQMEAMMHLKSDHMVVEDPVSGDLAVIGENILVNPNGILCFYNKHGLCTFYENKADYGPLQPLWDKIKPWILYAIISLPHFIENKFDNKESEITKEIKECRSRLTN